MIFLINYNYNAPYLKKYFYKFFLLVSIIYLKNNCNKKNFFFLKNYNFISYFTTTFLKKYSFEFNYFLKFKNFFLIKLNDTFINDFFNCFYSIFSENLEKKKNFYIFSKFNFFNFL